VICHAALIALCQELQDWSAEWSKGYPNSGSNLELPKKQTEFAHKMKSKLVKLFTRAKAEADKVSLGAYFAATCLSLPQLELEYHATLAFVKKQLDIFEAVMNKVA
jgi:hypothetical protein